MNKENLIIIAGMPRSGTSYLYKALDDHPEIYMPIIKETNYFIYNNNKGIDWFDSLYNNASPSQKMFDISPFYFLDNEFFSHVKKFNKEQKVILLLRDPNEWIKSAYKQIKKQSYKVESFEEFLNGHSIKFEDKEYKIDFKTFDYIGVVERFRKEFKENLLLLDFDEFEKDKLKVLQKIEVFINVAPFFNQTNISEEKVNAGDVNNNKLIAYLSTIGVLRDIAFKVSPNWLVHFIRNKYILGEAVKKSDSLPNIYKEENIFKKYFQTAE
ncbi:MAG: hypothetical protein GQ474_10840 [Sulfurimonas sp.]|nr:hypothetical protein [Sulfurimonas sp.]